MSALLLLTAACGSGVAGSTPLAPPSALTYSQATIAATTGQPIASDSPRVTGSVASYTVSPALPAGLSLNSSTGAIAGTPSTAAAQTTYIVSASNAGGNTTASIQITVTAAVMPPSNLVYPQATIKATTGRAIVADVPMVTGTVSLYTASPALPAGLILSSSTGTISGTPTAVAASTAYIVTASNLAGSATTSLQISVSAAIVAPSNLSYPQPTIATTLGQVLVAEIPTVTGTVISYTINAALPAGLSLDAATGTISGTAAVAQTQANYVVTGSPSQTEHLLPDRPSPATSTPGFRMAHAF